MLADGLHRQTEAQVDLPRSDVNKLPEMADSIFWPAEMSTIGSAPSSLDDSMVSPANASSAFMENLSWSCASML